MRIPGTNVRIGPNHGYGYSQPVYYEPYHQHHHYHPGHQGHLVYHDVKGAGYNFKNAGHHIAGRRY